MKKLPIVLSAFVLAATSTISSFPAFAAESYDMNVSINLDGETHEISPYIYGINQYGNTNNYRNVTVNAVRQGGNRYTGYNWETNWSNAGEDYVNSSDTNIGDVTDGAGYAARKLSEECTKYNIPYKLTTLQMAGYVAADKDGTVSESEAAPSDRWNEVVFRKDSELSLEPDLTDGKVYMDEYVNYLVQTLGDATTSTGIQGYSLDNEPFLWNDTHPLNHAEECGCNELIDKSIELASVIKEIDPDAEVFGPALWGMLPCITAGTTTNFTDQDWESIKSNYSWYVDYYLESMANAEKETGTRLLDVFDVHYYAQDCSTDDSRLQAARSLYGSTYVEDSWLQPYYGKYYPFLTRLQESIEKYYPGTKLAVSEYNLADISNEKTTGKSVVSAIAETEALGAFALNDVYLATYWGTLPDCPYVESAINLYTNYDGEGAAFGDTLVEASTDDLSKAAAFASIDGTDDSEITVVLSNKDKTLSEKAVIDISGSSSDYKSAVVYAITQDSSDIRIIDVQNNLSDGTIEVELPPLSVAQIVISDEATDKTVYEEPDITVKEVSYNFDELEDNNGAKIIPLGDKEHLKEIVISLNTYSTEGSSYFGGGGGLCFNTLIPTDGGSSFWGCKNYSYSKDVTEITIDFDEYFTNANSEEVTASVSDDTAELQTDWWRFSEKEGNDGTDVVVNYTKVTLIYKYDNSTLSNDVKGDVNADSVFSIADVVMLQKWLLGSGKLTSWEVGDLYEDKIINGFDLSVMRNMLSSQEA